VEREKIPDDRLSEVIELARFRGWSVEEAWEKCHQASEILNLQTPGDGLDFCLESARTEEGQKQASKQNT
jgi:hypothetical protein